MAGQHQHTSSFQNPNVDDLPSFHLFPNLPTELRNAIWYATLLPRTVEILYRYPSNQSGPAGFMSYAAIPGALEACRESRALVESLYPLCFAGQSGLDNVPRIRINFAIDTVYLSGNMRNIVPIFIGMMCHWELSHLRSLAIHGRHLFYDIRRSLPALTGLKELLIVCDVSIRQDGHRRCCRAPLRFLDEAPENITMQEKARSNDFQHLEVWDSPRCRSVFGWRDFCLGDL